MASSSQGWRPFRIIERRSETPDISSFLLVPEDGAPIPSHVAGQHLTLRLPAPVGLIRNYTISTAPNGRNWRISPKRQGAASGWLHDHAQAGSVLEVSGPSGAFVLPPDEGRPVVMVSAGVGVTPMIAMLEAVAEAPQGRAVHFIHAVRDASHHPFAAHVAALIAMLPGSRADVFYSRGADAEAPAGWSLGHGRLTADVLRAQTPVETADYLLCGPVDFLRDMASGLVAAGVPRGRIHYEFFGPPEEVLEEVAPAAPQPSSSAPPPARVPQPVTDDTMSLEDQLGRALLASAADAVVACDREGIITLWNPGAERIFGFTPEEAVGQSLDIIIPEPFRARHWEGYHVTVATGESRYGAGDLLAVPGLRKDGARISIEFTIVLLKDGQGQVSGMISSIRDVSRRFEETKALKKRVAELEKAASGG